MPGAALRGAQRLAGEEQRRSNALCDFHGLQVPRSKFWESPDTRLLLSPLLFSVKLVMRADTRREANNLLTAVCTSICEDFPEG